MRLPGQGDEVVVTGVRGAQDGDPPGAPSDAAWYLQCDCIVGAQPIEVSRMPSLLSRRYQVAEGR